MGTDTYDCHAHQHKNIIKTTCRCVNHVYNDNKIIPSTLPQTDPTPNSMFDHAHEVILADTEASRAIHRKVRYHVYCLERGFENPSEFPFGEEYDRWDTHAAQFIVRQRASGKWVAAMRIILPHAATFPLETLQCLEPTHKNRLRRRELGEISRVCVVRSPDPHAINRHLSHNFGSVNNDGESEVLLGLIRALILYGLEQGIEHCYMLVTGAFARLLRRLGVVLRQVGIAIEHRGWRAPYLMGLRDSAASMSGRSALVRDLFARKALAYQPFSALDDDTGAIFETPPPFPHADIGPSRSSPGIWRRHTEWTTRPGPGVWLSAS